MWRVAGAAGIVVLLTGLLPLQDARAVLDRVTPILVFLAAVTILAELADAAGVFDVAAHVAAGLARGRVLALWLLVVALATATTIVLSLDTTAVLLTPVVLALAAQLELPALPFAMTTVWLANTASLLLPVSNLTNLLAVDRLGWSATTYGRHTWAAAVASVAVTVVVLYALHRRDLSGRYVAPRREPVEDAVLFWLGAGVCLVLAVLFVAGVPYWAAACAGAAVLLAGFVLRRRASLRWSLVPLPLVVTTLGLFLVVEAAEVHGLSRALRDAVGSDGGGLLALLRVSGVGALSSNLVNNLPAYLAIEPAVAASHVRLLALLVGTNLGPLLTLWGSLATLLWRERCRTRDVHVSWRRFGLEGMVLVPLVLLAATAALAATT
ncbi:MAG TPA: SLC13 family permease [Actinomycetes bacterium]|nr:SLC13 family permease [Actinomycetes bacterium]